MPTSNKRHPSRDAVLRDALGQLKEQKGVTLDAFAFSLNALAHSLCPLKMTDQIAISSLTQLDASAIRVISAWRKKVERWASGDVELPVWLEEVWVTALEELGDESTRVLLTRRHGFLGVTLSSEGLTHKTLAGGIGSISKEYAEAISATAALLTKQDLSDLSAEELARVRKEYMDVVQSAQGVIALVDAAGGENKKADLKLA